MPISEPEIFSFRRHKRKQHLFPFNECSWNGSHSLMVATYSTPLTRTAKRLQVALVSQVLIDTSRPAVFWFLGLKLPLWSNCGKSQIILLYGKSVKITVPPRWHTVISTFPLLFYWPDPSKVGWCHKIKFLNSICIQASSSNSFTELQTKAHVQNYPHHQNIGMDILAIITIRTSILSWATTMNKPPEKSHKQKQHYWILVTFHIFKLSYSFVPFFTYFCEYPASVL